VTIPNQHGSTREDKAGQATVKDVTGWWLWGYGDRVSHLPVTAS